MGCIRSRSKILGRWTLFLGVCVCVILPTDGWAAFASRFSLTVAEEYSDNIFFTKKKDHDFITNIVPTLTLHYAPAGETLPTLNLNLSPGGQIFARHSELNNFGDNISLNGGYTYRYSPRLEFHASDTLARSGQTRTSGLFGGGGSFSSLPPTPTAPPPVGGTNPPSSSQRLNYFMSGGDTITNSFSLGGSFRYREDISFTGHYSNNYTKFIDSGGSDIFHTVGFRGVYNWRQDHNLHAGYSMSIAKTRDGDNNVIHNFDFGDDYFTNYVHKIQVTPTLSLSASTGLSISTGSGGFGVSNNSTATITKLWETATLTGGIRKGLTPSFGVSGISDTTSFFTHFTILLTERLSGRAGVDFSLFDTKDVNFNTFETSLGLQYAITTWLSANLRYSYRWVDSGAGASSTDLLERGKVSSNNVFLNFTTSFDIWPNVGLARGMTSPTLTPVLPTPFPTPLPAPTTSQP